MQKIVEKIEKLTKENGKSGTELGLLLGLKKSPLTDWKNEKSKPTLEQIIKICDIFGISADYLLNTNQVLTSNEKQLLSDFRSCSEENKKILLNAAKGMKQELINKEEKSSKLMIG